MLCTSCRNKPNCLAAQLAESDAVVDQLLRQLKRCSLRPRRTVWQRINAFGRSLWGRLRWALTH
ncbi:hypothetical protein IQ265_19300 [Nodosilinea sp. LEGE 06152]|uniref:hypothetical protein n=1 Tax=Nodosilinea sp. LEGE 06152 TaxID=2777966 RepID=UPI00187F4A94|nr:hypothetical protein [Nodosilinea sp. LEGE 06152]MBE9158965.1 hypothetical protein [Nodosilinea sp. LEGE 06152]